jgi:hypothetical protein
VHGQTVTPETVRSVIGLSKLAVQQSFHCPAIVRQSETKWLLPCLEHEQSFLALGVHSSELSEVIKLASQAAPRAGRRPNSSAKKLLATVRPRIVARTGPQLQQHKNAAAVLRTQAKWTNGNQLSVI